MKFCLFNAWDTCVDYQKAEENFLLPFFLFSQELISINRVFGKVVRLVIANYNFLLDAIHMTCISSCFYIFCPFQISYPILIILISKAFEKIENNVVVVLLGRSCNVESIQGCLHRIS